MTIMTTSLPAGVPFAPAGSDLDAELAALVVELEAAESLASPARASNPGWVDVAGQRIAGSTLTGAALSSWLVAAGA